MRRRCAAGTASHSALRSPEERPMAPTFEELSDRDQGVVARFLRTAGSHGGDGAQLPAGPRFFDHPELVTMGDQAAKDYCFDLEVTGDVDVNDAAAWTTYQPLSELA